MSDSQKYYYMRLKENFFDTNEMKVLESIQDGYKYSNILLKLYLMSLKTNGKLMLNDRIPYNSQMIASITRHSVGDVEKALKFFKELGLIEVMDSGAIYMLDIQNYIGKASSEADRKRNYRQKIESEKQNNGQMSTQISDKSAREIELEIELDIEKDIKKKNIKKESSKTKVFSKPSNQEILDYCNSIGHGEFDIEKFIDYYESNGWKVGKNPMKDWKATVRNWIRKNESQQKGSKEKGGVWF